MNKLKIREQLKQFFLEDIGDRDITSETIFPMEKVGTGTFLVKENGTIAGLGLIIEAYKLIDDDLQVELLVRDGQTVTSGQIIAEVHGSVSSILTGERVILNLLQRMSGIATLTRACVTSLNSKHTKICDTRKTTPGLRMFEKYAVTCGGGVNHRFGLYDGVMIKDNHIAFLGSITRAVEAVRSKVGHMVKVEVETETKEQVLEAVEAGVDVIMFDNRIPDEVEQFVKLVPPSIITEASGGITIDNIAEYGHTNVDYLSLGLLTHSARSLDISLQV